MEISDSIYKVIVENILKKLNGEMPTVLISIRKIEENTPDLNTSPRMEFALASTKQTMQINQMLSRWVNAV